MGLMLVELSLFDIIKTMLLPHLDIDALVRLDPDDQLVPDSLLVEDIPRHITVLNPHLHGDVGQLLNRG